MLVYSRDLIKNLNMFFFLIGTYTHTYTVELARFHRVDKLYIFLSFELIAISFDYIIQ